MEICIDESRAREMASRLRSTFGTKTVSQSKSLEALAKTLGYADWNTLSGMLKRDTKEKAVVPAIARLLVGKPFDLYWEAYACSDLGESPGWAKVAVDQAFLDQVLATQALCVDKKLDHIALDFNAEWDDVQDLQIRDTQLIVTEYSFWLRASPRYANYHVETRSIEIEYLRGVLGTPTVRYECLAWADGVLFADGASAKQFALGLLDDEHIAINEGDIDEMPTPF